MEITLWALWNETRDAVASDVDLACLDRGWTLDDDGVLRLEAARGAMAGGRPAAYDDTQFEAFESHQHLDAPMGLSGPDEVEARVGLWRGAVVLACSGLERAREVVGDRTVIAALSLGGIGQGATVRWHLDRGLSDRWLSGNLEGYKSEAVLEISSIDTNVHGLAVARMPDPVADLQD